VVTNAYISFCMLSSGLVIPRFYKWNFCSGRGFVGSRVVWLIVLFNRIDIEWVEFLLISWLHRIGIGASIISIAKNKWSCGHCWLVMQNCFKCGFEFSIYVWLRYGLKNSKMCAYSFFYLGGVFVEVCFVFL
jgi:hypothetical protein